MSISLNLVEDMQEHLMVVFERSAHHAGEVNEVMLSLIGAMLWRKNPGDPLKVNTKEGEGGNVIWFKVDDTRYALLYSHTDKHIKLMAGGRKGELVQTFTNDTTTNEVAKVFAGLGNSVPELSKQRKIRKEDRDPNAPKPPKDPRVKKARRLAKAAGKEPKNPEAKAARLAARAGKPPKDPAVKAARQAAKASKAPKDPQGKTQGSRANGARDPRDKTARALARDVKVTARREQRRNTRAADKKRRRQPPLRRQRLRPSRRQLTQMLNRPTSRP
jgi:hypothetical protein